MPGIDKHAKLLLHCDGSDGSTSFVDSSLSPKTITAVGTAQIDTAYKQFGSGSLLLDGNSGYLTIPDNADWDFGAEPFTIDFRVRFNVLPSAGQFTFLAHYNHADERSWWFYILESNGNYLLRLVYSTDGTAGTVASKQVTWVTPTINKLYHIALVRNGNDLYFLVDGVQVGSTQDVTGITLFSSTALLTVGTRDLAFDYLLNGWMDEIRISKGIARWISNFTPPARAYDSEVGKSYHIEWRDKNGELKGYLIAPDVTWEWKRIGGCGNCSISLAMKYRKIEFDADDDIQIWMGSSLKYRGYIENPKHIMKTPQGITLNVKGYFDKLSRIAVHDSADKKVYLDNSISDIVTDVIDTFVVPNMSITKGTIDSANFTADILEFKVSALEVLRTLAELEGEVEYGVDENLVFFWRVRDTTLRHKFIVGNNVSMLERKIDWSKLVNKIIFEGGEVNGAKFLREAEASDSRDTYFKADTIINNSSILTSSVASQYLSSILKEKSAPTLIFQGEIVNTPKRLEDNIPMGEVAFYDADYDENSYIVGEAVDGGSDLTIGLVPDGGSGATVGALYQGQIDKVTYTPSETEDRVNMKVYLGNSILETAAKIKQLELLLSSIRQR